MGSKASVSFSEIVEFESHSAFSYLLYTVRISNLGRNSHYQQAYASQQTLTLFKVGKAKSHVEKEAEMTHDLRFSVQ
jgi:hypothetical protein